MTSQDEANWTREVPPLAQSDVEDGADAHARSLKTRQYKQPLESFEQVAPD